MGQPAPSPLASELPLIMLTAEQEHFLQGWIWRNQTEPGTKEQHQSPARDKSGAPGPVQSNFQYLHLWTPIHVCLPLLWKILFFIYNQIFLCCNLFPLALPLFAVPPQKAFSATIFHIFEDSNDISLSPFFIKAEQTSTHLSWCIMYSNPLPLDSLLPGASFYQGNSNRILYSTQQLWHPFTLAK